MEATRRDPSPKNQSTRTEKTMSIHILETLHQHHVERVAHRKFEQEIASYASEADRLDIEAILARYSDAETAEIRQILAVHAA